MTKSEGDGGKSRGLAPQDWEKFFLQANVRVEALAECKSERSKAVKMGQFLSPMVGREVPIQVKGRSGRAVLRTEEGRSKVKLYFFEVHWDVPDAQTSPTPGAGKDNKGPKKPGGKKTAEKTKAKGSKTARGGTRTEQGAAAKDAAGSKQTKTAKKPMKKTGLGGEEKAGMGGDKKAAAKPPEKKAGGKPAGRDGGGNELDW
jgi:hypothetical protein